LKKELFIPYPLQITPLNMPCVRTIVLKDITTIIIFILFARNAAKPNAWKNL